MTLLAIAILLNLLFQKKFKKYLFNVQYDLKVIFSLQEKLNGLNFFKKSLSDKCTVRFKKSRHEHLNDSIL